MITKELRDNSMMDMMWLDFISATSFDDGSIILRHIDKHGEYDNSSIIILRPDDVDKLKEMLNGKA